MFTNSSKKIFSPEALAAIAEAISATELTTSGEVRVVVRTRRSLWERRKSVHELAVKEFFRLGMDRTRDRTGVIIFILLAEHRFAIAADQGINDLVTQDTWDRVADALSGAFRDGRFQDGVTRAITDIAKILGQHFPRRSDDTNELPNDVVLR